MTLEDEIDGAENNNVTLRVTIIIDDENDNAPRFLQVRHFIDFHLQ